MDRSESGGDGKTGGLHLRIAIPAWRWIGRMGATADKSVSQQEIRRLFHDELQDLRTWRKNKDACKSA